MLKSGQRAIKSVCRECANRIGRERQRWLYKHDAAFRQRNQDYSRGYYQTLSPAGKRAKALRRKERRMAKRKASCP